MSSKFKILTGTVAITAVLALFSTTASADPYNRHHHHDRYHPHHFHPHHHQDRHDHHHYR